MILHLKINLVDIEIKIKWVIVKSCVSQKLSLVCENGFDLQILLSRDKSKGKNDDIYKRRKRIKEDTPTKKKIGK